MAGSNHFKSEMAGSNHLEETKHVTFPNMSLLLLSLLLPVEK
jgi:hypothetical protein